ncbi:Fic family protein [Bacteroides cellulolyticus]|uniref:Fic family protein n=1 Tax=Bacteroides cellulolyticus TaxID=2981780 RepID=UPI00338F2AEA
MSNTSPQVKNDITPRTDNIHPQSSISSPQVTPQEKVFDFCNTPRSISEIAKMLGVNDKKWVRKKYITPFIGITLEPTIPDKPNSRNQKYKTIKKKL